MQDRFKYYLDIPQDLRDELRSVMRSVQYRRALECLRDEAIKAMMTRLLDCDVDKVAYVRHEINTLKWFFDLLNVELQTEQELETDARALNSKPGPSI